MNLHFSDNKKKDLLLFLVLFLLIFVRYLAGGMEYSPLLDDYIQLHNYAQNTGGLAFLYEEGILSSRPLAGFLDYYYWSGFYDCLIIAIAQISLLLAGAAVLCRRLLSRFFDLSPLFCVIFTLVPAAVEGHYWLAASTRIVPGLFFSVLSCWFFRLFVEKGRVFRAVLFLVFQLISFGFYEQTLVFSCALCLVVFLFSVKENRRRSFLAFATVIDLAAYFGICALFSRASVYTARIELALPETPWYFNSFVPEVLSQMKSVFWSGNLAVLGKGFLRGFGCGNLFVLLALLLFSVSLAFLFSKKDESSPSSRAKRRVSGLLFGLFLTVLPAAIFFFIANPWFSFRCMAASLPGAALFLDSLLSLIPQKRDMIRTVSTCALSFVFCVAALSEISDYRETSALDKAISVSLQATVSDYPEDARVLIYDLDPSRPADQNYGYHEHIHGVTESSWALTGMMTALYPSSRSFTPLPSENPYSAWNRDASQPENFDYILVFRAETNSFIEADYRREGDRVTVLDKNGTVLFFITEENGTGTEEHPDIKNMK